jgi:serine protease inhibitor
MRAGLAMLVPTMLALAVVASGCASATPERAAPPGPVAVRGVAVVEPAADPRPLGAADTAFGLDVLRAWCAQYPRQNLVFSPSTLATALGMAYLGARGTTARIMAGVLHLPASGQALVAELQARTKALGGLESPGVTLAASDNVWADPTLPLQHAYLNTVATGYDAGVTPAPFSTEPRRAADEINQSISRATHGHIRQIVTPGMLAQIGWVLTSALYMNAAWATAFDPDQTMPGPFTLAGGASVTAKFMNGDHYRFASAAGWQAVSLPYKGGKLAMTALLPPPGAGSCALPGQAALRTMTAALSGPAGSADTVRVSLPKVNLDTNGTTGDMSPVLKALGMGQAFTDAADFLGLSQRACCIGFVQQAATLQVGEKGTVASAAAAVGIIAASSVEAPPHTVVFNRPYLMLVTDAATGEPLFLAKVADPTRSS